MAAGATLLVGAILLGGPAVSACAGDSRGLAACLRGMVDDKFDLGLEGEPAVPPIVAEAPLGGATPETQVADVPASKPMAEPTRSLVPQLADKPPPAPVPAAPEPQVAAEPEVAAEVVAPGTVDAEPNTTGDAEPEPAAPAEPDVALEAEPAPAPDTEPVPQVAEVPIGPTPPHETIALAKVAEPVAAPAEVPSFVPPPPAIAVDGVPPDLQVAAAPPAPPEPAPAFALPTGPELPVTPPPDLTVAAIDPVAPAPEPPPAAPVLAPTIDAVEIEGDGSFIAGNGPAGANMRLYVDGLPVGVSPVEGGRWLVEGTDLLTEQRQTLKVEALDPLTGKLLGDATVTFERPAAPVAEEPAEPETPPAADPITLPAEPAEQLEVKPPPADAAKPVTTGPPPAIPPIAPVAPSGESPSVTILKPAGEPAVTTLPTGKPSADAVVTLGAAPRSPAVIAEFTLPTPKAAPSVTVLRAVPIGDPGAGRFVSGKAIIRRGDTLWDIAHRYYGRGVHYRTIVRANRDLIARPGKIYPGQVFDLPLVYDD